MQIVNLYRHQLGNREFWAVIAAIAALVIVTAGELWFSSEISQPAIGIHSLVALIVVFAAAGFFSGLSGFGFSAIGCISLAFIDPAHAIALLMILSLLTQAQSLASLSVDFQKHKAKEWRAGVGPYVAGGLVGLAIGTPMLVVVSGQPLMVALGTFLLIYAAYSLWKPKSLRFSPGQPHLLRSGVIGAIGGFIGAFSGFPGSALVVWNGLIGATKDASRALTQPYILAMQILGLSLALLIRPASFDLKLLELVLLFTPIALIGNRLGVAVFKRVRDESLFRKLTLIALGTSGVGLLVKSLAF